jgi:hypothetical protein
LTNLERSNEEKGKGEKRDRTVLGGYTDFITCPWLSSKTTRTIATAQGEISKPDSIFTRETYEHIFYGRHKCSVEFGNFV